MPDDPTDIPAWFRIDHRLTTSGQPSEDQLRTIHRLGVSRIINLGLHTHELALPDEASTVRALGMTYVHIPVPFDAPTQGDFDQFVDALHDAGDERVHVHCIVNARVSAFIYRYRHDVLGDDERAARHAMEQLWRPGGVWARFIGDASAVALPHRPPVPRTR